MKAALTAEATAEAYPATVLVPPSTTDFGVVHWFTDKTGGLTYKVELAPINGSTSAYSDVPNNPVDNEISDRYGSPCLRDDNGELKRGLLRDFQCRLGRQQCVEVGRRHRPDVHPSVKVGRWGTCAAQRLHHLQPGGFDSRVEWSDLSSHLYIWVRQLSPEPAALRHQLGGNP